MQSDLHYAATNHGLRGCFPPRAVREVALSGVKALPLYNAGYPKRSAGMLARWDIPYIPSNWRLPALRVRLFQPIHVVWDNSIALEPSGSGAEHILNAKRLRWEVRDEKLPSRNRKSTQLPPRPRRSKRLVRLSSWTRWWAETHVAPQAVFDCRRP